MSYVHHKPIRRFNVNGVIHDDSSIWRLRLEYHRLLVSEMREAGYVPRLDIDLDFTIDYNEEKEYFEFAATLYGVYLGKKKSKCVLGIDGIKLMYILNSKSAESSQDQESKLNQR